MSKDKFLEDLAAILEVEPCDLNDEFPLTTDNWDSLAIVASVVLIDEQFAVSIRGETLRNCTKVGELWQAIEQALSS